MALPFLNPWMLAALPAVALPVIIHLLNRHRATTIEWGAMELLRKVMVFRSRQIRLEDLLLMALRCLIILLAVLAVARPTTRLLPLVRNPDTGILIAVDVSMSMGHKPSLTSRFDEAMKRMRDVLRTVEPGRPITLLAMASRPRVLLRSAAYDANRAQEVLRGLAPSEEPLDFEAALVEIELLAAELKAPRREVFIITDAQAATFRRPSEMARQALSRLGASAEVFAVPVACAGEDNVAVSELEFTSGMLRAGAIARFTAVVRNHGRGAADAGELSLLINDQVVDRRFLGRLAPGASAALRLYAPLERAGVTRVVARLGDDALSADNVCHAVVNVRTAVRVLCVDGDPMEGADLRPAALVMTALSPTSLDRAEARPAVDLIPWTSLTSAKPGDYDVIVLVNVPDVPEDRAIALRKFVEQGGGLILMAGGNVKPDVLARRFESNGDSLLPARPVAAVDVSDDKGGGAVLDLDLPDHPIGRPLRSLAPELLSEGRFLRLLRVTPLPEARAVLRLAGGDPVIIERAVGRGKVLLWTTSVERTWSNLATNPVFPLLLQQAVTHLSRQPFEQPVVVPRPILLPLPGVAAGEDVAITSPDGAGIAAQATMRGGEVVVETPATTGAGFYHVQPTSESTPTIVATNVEPAESDVRTLSADELASAMAPARVRVLPADQSIAAAVSESRTGRELWQPLLAAAVLLLVVEALLARWYTRRGA